MTAWRRSPKISSRISSGAVFRARRWWSPSIKPQPSACTTRCRSTGSCYLGKSEAATSSLRDEMERDLTCKKDRSSWKRPTWQLSSLRRRTRSTTCRKKGWTSRPHRKRMVKEDLETKFKDPDDPLAYRLCLRHVDDRLRRPQPAPPSTSTSRCATTP